MEGRRRKQKWKDVVKKEKTGKKKLWKEPRRREKKFFFKLIVGAELQVPRVQERGRKRAGCGRVGEALSLMGDSWTQH